MNKKKVERLIRELLYELGEDPNREGLRETPARVAKAYEKLLEGYQRSLKKEIKVFNNTKLYNNIIVSGKIDFFSTCEHHLLPIWGNAYVGYIPTSKIIGLSKLSRAVDIHARRLQDQERITVDVADDLMNLLNPQGVAVLLKAMHFCNVCRGVEKINSYMTTIIFRGVFLDNTLLQNNFFNLLNIEKR